MEILVTYDVNTESKEGKRRLRRVAKCCEAFGQRVQKSVFECRLDRTKREELVHRLRKEMNEEEDSLRIYRLREPRDEYLTVYGRDVLFDLHEPLVL